MKRLILLFFVLTLLFSCTENERAKSFGGKLEITIDPKETFINITYKTDDI